MALPVYTTIARVKEIAMQSARGDLTKLEDNIAAASRLVDRMCAVPDGFFGIAGPSASVRKFQGHGTRRLRVDRYIPDSIESVEYAKLNCFTPDEYDEIIDEKGQHWLIASGCDVWRNAVIEVSARWGYEETPDEIEQVTIEMTLLLFRQRDPALTKIQIDVNGSLIKPEDITPRTRAICAEYKTRRPHVLI